MYFGYLHVYILFFSIVYTKINKYIYNHKQSIFWLLIYIFVRCNSNLKIINKKKSCYLNLVWLSCEFKLMDHVIKLEKNKYIKVFL